MTTLEGRRKRFAVCCVAPALLLYTFWIVLPALSAFSYALYRWDGLSDPEFVGGRHFRSMGEQVQAVLAPYLAAAVGEGALGGACFLLWGSAYLVWRLRPADEAFLSRPRAWAVWIQAAAGLALLAPFGFRVVSAGGAAGSGLGESEKLFVLALKNNLVLMTVPTAIVLVVSLVLAAALRAGVRGAGFFRVVFFFPNILSAVAISILWMLLYSTSGFGVFNNLLIGLGLVERPVPFTNTAVLVRSVIPMLVWTAAGFYMLLFLAAMQSIPESLYEAARVDGASPVSQFFHITLPMISDTIVTGLLFSMVAGLKLFDQIWVMEQQQARPASNTIATLMYSKIFDEYFIGYGTAIAVVLFAVVLFFSLLAFRFYRKEVLEY